MNTSASPSRWTPLLTSRAALGVAVGVIVAAVHAPSLGNGLTNWDDGIYVTGNAIAARGLEGLRQAWTSTFDNAWYPLTQTLYCLIRAVAGASPFAHHLVQWLLFAGTVALVPAALGAVGMAPLPAAIAALLWAVHPFRVESVAWVANLKDALMAFGVVAALAAWPRSEPRCGRAPARGSTGLSFAAFAAALLGKSMAFPTALLFPLVAWAQGDRLPRALRRAAPHLAAAAVVGIVAGVANVSSQAGSGRTYPGGSLVGAVPSALWLPWWYVGRTLLPVGSRALYAFVPVGWLDVRLLVAVLLWAAAVVWVATRGETRRRWVVLAAAWLLPLATVVGLVPMRFLVAERYTLLPSLALAAGLVAAASAPVRRAVAGRIAAAVLLASAAIALAAATLAREPQWHDGVALWEANRPYAPEVFAVRYNLGGAYGGAGRWREAVAELRAARRIDPNDSRVLGDLLFAMAATTDLPVETLLEWSRALVFAHDSDAAIGTLAAQIVELRKPELAQAFLDEVGREGSARILAARSKVALALGKPSEAFELARRAQRVDPGDKAARLDEVYALLALGRFKQALSISEVPYPEPELEAQRRKARSLAGERLGTAGAD